MAIIQDPCAAREAQAAGTSRLPACNFCTSRGVIDLSANENPLGPSPRALAAIAHAAKQAHRYPDKNGTVLKQELASRLGVATGQIVLGNGSAEVIDAIARATLDPGDEAIVGSPSFPAYRSSIARAGAAVTAVPLIDGAEDLATIAKRVSDRTRLVILANPNNPTGGTFGAARWEAFMAQMPGHVVVVVDEAYYEYVTRPDFPRTFEQVAAGQGVVVVRSFSKAYGLAGLRLGYGIAPTLLAQRIEQQVQHFNTSRVAQAAALAALCDEDYLAHCVAMNEEGRRYLQRELTVRGFLVPDSQANFLLVRMANAAEVHRHLQERGVLVKLLDGFGLADAIRVSVGGREDNERFLEALASVRLRPERDLQDGRI
jgi:histidinol-phosphate aminotransferase